MSEVKNESPATYSTQSSTKYLEDMTDDQIIEVAKEILNRRMFSRIHTALESVDTVKDFLHLHLAGELNEVFSAIWLDNQHCVIKVENLFFGSIDNSAVHARQVVQSGLKYNAAAVIFAHNHPSGKTKPSRSDISITKKLAETLDLFDIRVLDHFIVGREVTSMCELGITW